MKVNELMVGDWVYQAQYVDKADPNVGHGWKPVRVTSIPFDKDCFIEPIPLTAKILKKNGWKHWGSWEDSKLEGVAIFILNISFGKNLLGIEDSIEIRIDCDPQGDFHYMCNGESFCYVNHVHELQHALKLCGIEKEIEP